MANEILKARERLEKYSIAELGEAIWAFVSEDENYTRDMGKGVLDIYNKITTPEEFEVAEKVLIALTGDNITGLMDYMDNKREGLL